MHSHVFKCLFFDTIAICLKWPFHIKSSAIIPPCSHLFTWANEIIIMPFMTLTRMSRLVWITLISYDFHNWNAKNRCENWWVSHMARCICHFVLFSFLDSCPIVARTWKYCTSVFARSWSCQIRSFFIWQHRTGLAPNQQVSSF